MERVHSNFSRSYNNSSSRANLTPYSEGIFWGVILTPKRSLKSSFSGVKNDPKFGVKLGVKVTPKKELSCT